MRELLRRPDSLALPFVACALILAGCSKSPENAGSNSPQSVAKSPSFAKDVQPIFNDNCVACHQTGSAQQALILEPGKSFAAIMGVKSKESASLLVDPGKANRSYLLLKLNGKQQEVGGTGAQMPLGDALTPAQISTVQRWIDAGAPDN